jgi:hypothetical protein
MLKALPIVNGGLERLHDEITIFFENIRTANRWSSNLFTEVFYQQVLCKCPGLEKQLKEFWKVFRKLEPVLRGRICDEFIQQNRVKELCNGAGNLTRAWCVDAGSEFEKATKELFAFMYSDTLETASFRAFSGQCLRDHYAMFRQTYEITVCPFCGLEDYVDLGPGLSCRDAYDHYLHRANYPFASVNPYNLFPMCIKCNSTFKGAKEVLFSTSMHNRRRAVYPPEDTFEIVVTIENGFECPPYVSITLAQKDPPQDDEKFSTWLDLLCIHDRYCGRVITKRKDWITEVLAEITNPTDKGCLTAVLKQKRDHLRNAHVERMQREFGVKVPFLSYCIGQADALRRFLMADPQFKNYLIDRASALN